MTKKNVAHHFNKKRKTKYRQQDERRSPATIPMALNAPWTKPEDADLAKPPER
ncbi:MAG: hypothetical protein AB1649_00405 [Chloroflexota bacterium]